MKNTQPFRLLSCKIVLIVLLMEGAGLCLYPAAAQQPTSPNVLFVLADDLGWKDVGFMGSDYYVTPQLDSFARGSLVFDDAYAGAANCAPSRACLLSGMYGPRTGIYTVGSAARGNAKTRRLIPVENKTVLADSIFTLAEAFRQKGYITASIGKWHLGKDPRSQGFTYNVGGGTNGHPSSYFSPYHLPDLPEGPQGEYLTDRLTTAAIRFLKKHRTQPFFLYLPYYAVHTPLQAPEALVADYRKKPASQGQGNAVYAAMIQNMDQNFGRLLQALRHLGLLDNTLVVFTSDNGGIRKISHQDPLRAGKGSYYEGGIRVPLLMYWKGHITPGRTDVPFINLDFYPTLLTVCGIKRPVGKPLDGKDMSRFICGGQKKMPVRPLFWHFPVYLQKYAGKEDGGRDSLFRTRPGTAMRLGNWKLLEYFEDGGLELYNLKADPGESRNVVNRYPRRSRKMHQQMVAWRKTVEAPVPTKRNPRFVPGFVPPVKSKKNK